MKRSFESYLPVTWTPKKRGYMKKKVKPIPKFKSEQEERHFWETHDTTAYFDSTKMVRTHLPNLKPSTQSISLRLPLSLLEAIRIEANKRDVPYQSLIKVWLSERLRHCWNKGIYRSGAPDLYSLKWNMVCSVCHTEKRIMPERILVTGARGFLGSDICNYFGRRGVDTISQVSIHSSLLFNPLPVHG